MKHITIFKPKYDTKHYTLVSSPYQDGNELWAKFRRVSINHDENYITLYECENFPIEDMVIHEYYSEIDKVHYM